MQSRQRRPIQPVGPADQHQIGGLQLVRKQILKGIEVIEAGIGLPLGLHRHRIPHHMAGGQGFAIHHRHHRIDADTTANFGPTKSFDQGFGQRQSARLHHDAIELVGLGKQQLHGRQKFVLNRAAQTAIGQLHQASWQLLLGTETTTGNEITINADLAKLVDDHGQTQAAIEQELA